MSALYVENDPILADWLRRCISAGLIAAGDVDDRDIREVTGFDVARYKQVHLFAGFGLWSFALRVAGIPDDAEVWTGSCPCQPFSRAGRLIGFEDPRHLWPEFRRLIEERRPGHCFGEQIAGSPRWLAMVHRDLEAMDYAVGFVPIEAASAGARQRRDRYWFVAVADANGSGLPLPESHKLRRAERLQEGRAIAERAWRAAEPAVRVLADGSAGRVPTIVALGNAIDIRPAVAFISSYLDVLNDRDTDPLPMDSDHQAGGNEAPG